MGEIDTKWLTPALAVLTALLETGHLAHLYSDYEIVVLVCAISTAVAAIFYVVTEKELKIDTITPPPPPKQQPKKGG